MYSRIKLALNNTAQSLKEGYPMEEEGISLAQEEHELYWGCPAHVTQHQGNERVRLNAHPAQTVESQQHRAWPQYRAFLQCTLSVFRNPEVTSCHTD